MHPFVLLRPAGLNTLMHDPHLHPSERKLAIARGRTHTFCVAANEMIVTAINQQIGNEFSAMLQYYAIAAHFAAEALPELSAHFYKQAEEEKNHALRFIQFLIDTGSRVNISAAPAPEADFKTAEDAAKLSLEQEERVTSQINALVSMAKAESDYTTDNFLQWFVKEQLEEVASMEQLLRVVQRAGEGNLLRVEEYLAREKGRGVALSKEERAGE
jgi:ferritin